jgi:hypothetical protein
MPDFEATFQVAGLSAYDWFNVQHNKVGSLNAGLLDLSRYDNL